MSALPSLQIPVLCRNCGGPADLGGEFDVHCPYCDETDQLPEDRLDRALELKSRLAHAAGAHARLQGLQGALVSFYESRKGLTFNRVALALLATWGLYKYFVEIVPSHQGNVGLLGLGALSVATVTALPIGLFMGLFLARWRFRRTLRPHLFARPPAAAGLRARCRVCHGELPDSRMPSVRCTWCGAISLLTPQLHASAVRLARVDETRARHQGRATFLEASRAGNRLAAELTVAWVGSTVLVAAALVASALLMRWVD